MKRITYAAALLGLCLSIAPRLEAAPSQPFSGLSEAEAAVILRGESLFRQPGSWRELALPTDLPFSRELAAEIRQSGANYVGEVLMVIPADKAVPDLTSTLASLLGDVKEHVGIPYYSVRNRQTYDLYDKAVVEESKVDARGGALKVLLHMEPFRDYRASYVWSVRPEGLSFRSENLSHLEFRKTRAVAPGDLVWRLEAYRDGERWILYGIGRVKAFDMLGLLRERLSASFMGRIEAFYRSIFARLK